jgi:CubicO group peptidase (beta-lactamase class C family)
MFGEPLQFAPGTNSKYCNLGYLLLGLVVEQATGQRFVDYLRSSVLAPLGITDVGVARTLKMQRLTHEVTYDQNGVGLSALNPLQEVLAPYAYGGEGWLTESMDAVGGLACSVTSMVKLIHHHAVWGIGGRLPGGSRSGSMAGVSSLAASRADGIDYAFVFNTRDIPTDAMHKLGDSLNAHLDALK